MPLRIDALPEQRLPDPVEVTVYYLVAEALSNAVKHAGATEVRVDVHRRGPVLHAEVADDGAGGATAGPGSGLHGLTDRLEALGGRLEVESAPGAGTRLRASIPLAPWRDGREPFIEFGYEGDGGSGRALDRADRRRAARRRRSRSPASGTSTAGRRGSASACRSPTTTATGARSSR